jgi:molecular chaperone DnaK (HSP70)
VSQIYENFLLQLWKLLLTSDCSKLQYGSATIRQDRLWGFEIDPIPDPSKATYEMFKLGLDPNREIETELARRYPNVIKLPTEGEEIEELVVDYLTALREHLVSHLQTHLTSFDLESIPKQYIITVPAVWSEKAQSRTRSCAEKAGMGHGESVRIISEPEAAAIHELEELRSDEFRFQIDDTIVVCDAGGG